VSTTSTSLLELVPTEKIEIPKRTVNLAPQTALRVADGASVGAASGPQVAIPWPEEVVAPAGTKDENAEFELVEQTADEATVTSGTVGFTYRISKELTYDAIVAATALAAQNGFKALAKRIDVDGLSLITSAANISNHTGNRLTETRFINARFAMDAQNPEFSGRLAFVAPPIPLRDLVNDMRDSGGAWTGGDAQSQEIRSQLTAGSGFMGVLHDTLMFKTTDCPTTGDDANCGLIVMGPTSPLAYRVWETMMLEDEYKPRRKAWELTVSARYGWSKARDAELREIVVLNTA
jgi:hypothetical protein